MRDTITNFLKMEVQTSIGLVYGALLVVWLIILIAGICSIVTRPMGIAGKLVWILLVVGLPLVGMVFYCLYSLFKADYSFLQQLGFFPGNKPAPKPKVPATPPPHSPSTSS